MANRTDQHAEHSEQHISTRTYWLIFAVLMVLLVLTVAAAQVDFGPFNIAVALTIACIKAAVIVLYFMHVRFSTRLIWLFASAGFFWLLIMLGLTLNDYVTRPIIPIPGR